MVEEYWVNVYEAQGATWQGKPMSRENTDYMIKHGGTNVAYRIHVKMDGGYRKKYKPGHGYKNPNKLNWMG